MSIRLLTMPRLPSGYYWEVVLIQRLNTAHLYLCKGRYSAVTQLRTTCAVLKVFDQDIGDIVRQIIQEADKMKSEYFKVTEDKRAWEDKANQLSQALGGVKVKVKVVR